MHGSATTTPEIRRAIQTSGLSIRALARRYSVNPKTIVKWKARLSTEDLPMGPHHIRDKTLSLTEEATCTAFRIQARLPLDDCLYALQLMFPHLTRSTLHRLFQRYGIQRLPDTNAPSRKTQGQQIGHFYIDAADIRTGNGRANMFFAFDRTSKIAFARLYDFSDPANGAAFLDALVNAVPYTVRRVITGSGEQFANARSHQNLALADSPAHPFALACRERSINHDLLPPDQPWNIGQIGTVQASDAATAKSAAYYESHDELREHFLAFFETYNFERRLKTLRGLTPFEFVCQCWEEDTDGFRHAPHSRGRLLTG